MKWNEIPKFQEFGLINSINFGFISYVDFIKEQIEKYNLQLDPDFQRGHVWNEEQQIKYIEFILRGGKSGRDFYFNHNRDNNEYICVDGLQRTMAIIKFIDGEIKVFNQYFEEFGFTCLEAGVQPLPEFRVNVYINYLEKQKEILEWYVDMNAGGTPHTEEEIERVKKMICEVVGDNQNICCDKCGKYLFTEKYMENGYSRENDHEDYEYYEKSDIFVCNDCK